MSSAPNEQTLQQQILSQVDTTKINEKMITLLKTACSTMQHKGKNLADDVTRYILTGEPVACVQLIDNAQGTNNAVHSPGYYSLSHAQCKKATLQSLLQFVKQAPIDGDVLRRFAVICQACESKNTSRFKTQTEMTGWLSALIIYFDNLAYYIESKGMVNPASYFPSYKVLQNLADQFDVPSDPISIYLLEADYGHTHRVFSAYLYSRNTFHKNLSKSINWPEFILTENLANKLQQYDNSARQNFCDSVDEYCKTLGNEQADIILQLALDPLIKTRKIAIKVLRKADDAYCYSQIEAMYDDAKPAIRTRLVAIAVTLPDHKVLLDKWLAAEKSKSVIKALDKALAVYKTDEAAQDFNWQIPEEVAADTNTDIPADWMERLLATKEKIVQNAKKDQAEAQALYDIEKKGYILNQIKSYSEKSIKYNNLREEDIASNLTAFDEGKFQSCSQDFITLSIAAKMENHPDISLCLLLKVLKLHKKILHWKSCWDEIYHMPFFVKLVKKELTDFRQLVTIAKYVELDEGIAQELLRSHHFPEHLLDLQTWPYFAEHKEHIEQGLNGKLVQPSDPKEKYYSNASSVIINTLAIVSHFPVIPAKWKNRIYEIAVGSKVPKIVQVAAQQCVEKLASDKIGAGKSKVDTDLIAAQLTSKTKEFRVEAANWLARLNAAETMPAISQAIKNEKDIPIRAALIANFEKLGGNIKPFLSIEVLAREALAGLKEEPPKTMAWFTKEAIPECYFQDGQKVDANIIYWWLVLAVTLKTPQGNPLLDSYLNLLDQASKKNIANHVLTRFIAHDTLCPSDEVTHAFAEQHKKSTFSSYAYWSQHDESYRHKTLEDAYNQCFSEHKSIYVGSAIKEKGMLCFIKGGDSAELLTTIQLFMKNHFLRRAQIESMLMPLADSDDPAIIQFLLSTSRRYRAKSIQDIAKTLVTQIAERNHWTADELADRTIQTVGLSHVDRPTEFEYGSRTLSISLSDDLKLNLFNDSGKLIKALPQPRQQDVKERISEAKKWFSNCKKELKQIATQQAERLQEAMISNRTWSAQDWLEYLHQHPVMFRLLQRTLWQVQANENDPWVAFRPTEDGDFIDVNDDEVTIKKDSQIRVLSANQLSSAEQKQWQQNLKDYKIKPLFEQLRTVDVELTKDQASFEQYYGYLTDSLTLRGLLVKKLYKRGEAMDAGFFEDYRKNYDSLGVQVRFLFSGNCVPEENVTVAIYEMMVIPLSEANAYTVNPIPFSEIAPNLLNEMAIDYADVAKKCQQDDNWKSQLPW